MQQTKMHHVATEAASSLETIQRAIASNICKVLLPTQPPSKELVWQLKMGTCLQLHTKLSHAHHYRTGKVATRSATGKAPVSPCITCEAAKRTLARNSSHDSNPLVHTTAVRMPVARIHCISSLCLLILLFMIRAVQHSA